MFSEISLAFVYGVLHLGYLCIYLLNDILYGLCFDVPSRSQSRESSTLYAYYIIYVGCKTRTCKHKCSVLKVSERLLATGVLLGSLDGGLGNESSN